MKVLEKYLSGMTLHKFYYDMDSLHSLACFWAWEDSLWRRHTKFQITSFVFQDMHYQRDNRVSKMITISIRYHPSKHVPKNKKDVYSSKYLHISPITKMAAQRGVDFFESYAQSGQSVGTYKER